MSSIAGISIDKEINDPSDQSPTSGNMLTYEPIYPYYSNEVLELLGQATLFKFPNTLGLQQVYDDQSGDRRIRVTCSGSCRYGSVSHDGEQHHVGMFVLVIL